MCNWNFKTKRCFFRRSLLLCRVAFSLESFKFQANFSESVKHLRYHFQCGLLFNRKRKSTHQQYQWSHIILCSFFELMFSHWICAFIVYHIVEFEIDFILSFAISFSPIELIFAQNMLFVLNHTERQFSLLTQQIYVSNDVLCAHWMLCSIYAKIMRSVWMYKVWKFQEC